MIILNESNDLSFKDFLELYNKADSNRKVKVNKILAKKASQWDDSIENAYRRASYSDKSQIIKILKESINEFKKINESKLEKFNYGGERFLKYINNDGSIDICIDSLRSYVGALSKDNGKTWEIYDGNKKGKKLGTERISQHSAGVDRDVADIIIQYAGLEN